MYCHDLAYIPKTVASFGFGYYIQNHFSMSSHLAYPLPPRSVCPNCHHLGNPPNGQRHFWTTHIYFEFSCQKFRTANMWRHNGSALYFIYFQFYAFTLLKVCCGRREGKKDGPRSRVHDLWLCTPSFTLKEVHCKYRVRINNIRCNRQKSGMD